jgi:stage II sporulation SpoD-like protein
MTIFRGKMSQETGNKTKRNATDMTLRNANLRAQVRPVPVTLAMHAVLTPWLKATAVLVAALFAAALMAPAARAATPAYAAKEMIRSGSVIEFEPGETKEFAITFKNTGSATWVREGKNFVSAYTHGPKYRKTQFADMSWMSDVQPGRITEPQVKPGQLATVRFMLFAPLEEGSYKETFHLAAESLAWIPGGQFTVDVVVKKKSPLTTAGGVRYASGFKAFRMLVSDKQLKLDAGTTKEFRVGFKNVGRTSWTKSGSAPIVLKTVWNGTDPLAFKHASWSNNVAATLPESEIKPGQLVFLNVTLSAPSSGGAYTPKFVLSAGEELVEGGEVEIPVEVRQGSVSSTVNQGSGSDFSRSGARGPNIRVGLISSSQPLVLDANGPYALYDGDGNKVRDLSGITTSTFDPATKTYTVTNGGFSFVGRKYVKFTPHDPASTVFEIRSYENRPTWDTSVNFNKFRGSIEHYHVSTTGRTWVTEEVPLEDYMRGLAETSNGSPADFQKALVTAARTYALFVVSIGGKHKSEFFDLNTTGNDQVYKGYASELIRPNVVRAVEETRGQVVTYGGEIVVTPYFSRSDGRTRSWTEVWSSKVHPWLVSKPAPYDQGKELWGHGVGMSASDAVGRAAAGTSWQDILKYYYTGIELKQWY